MSSTGATHSYNPFKGLASYCSKMWHHKSHSTTRTVTPLLPTPTKSDTAVKIDVKPELLHQVYGVSSNPPITLAQAMTTEEKRICFANAMQSAEKNPNIKAGDESQFHATAIQTSLSEKERIEAFANTIQATKYSVAAGSMIAPKTLTSLYSKGMKESPTSNCYLVEPNSAQAIIWHEVLSTLDTHNRAFHSGERALTDPVSYSSMQFNRLTPVKDKLVVFIEMAQAVHPEDSHSSIWREGFKCAETARHITPNSADQTEPKTAIPDKIWKKFEHHVSTTPKDSLHAHIPKEVIAPILHNNNWVI